MGRLKAPSPALVIAVIALFAALGGTGYAAGRLTSGIPGPGTLPAGQSESGIFGGADGYSSGNGYIGLSITYPLPLPKAIKDSHIIDVHGTRARHCPGAGRAARGYLCLYDRDRSGSFNNVDFYSSDGRQFPASGGKVGVLLYWFVGTDSSYVGGEWTVTAP